MEAPAPAGSCAASAASDADAAARSAGPSATIAVELGLRPRGRLAPVGRVRGVVAGRTSRESGVARAVEVDLLVFVLEGDGFARGRVLLDLAGDGLGAGSSLSGLDRSVVLGYGDVRVLGEIFVEVGSSAGEFLVATEHLLRGESVIAGRVSGNGSAVMTADSAHVVVVVVGFPGLKLAVLTTDASVAGDFTVEESLTGRLLLHLRQIGDVDDVLDLEAEFIHHVVVLDANFPLPHQRTHPQLHHVSHPQHDVELRTDRFDDSLVHVSLRSRHVHRGPNHSHQTPRHGVVAPESLRSLHRLFLRPRLRPCLRSLRPVLRHHWHRHRFRSPHHHRSRIRTSPSLLRSLFLTTTYNHYGVFTTARPLRRLASSDDAR